VEQAVAVFSEPSLLLFVRLKTSPTLSVHHQPHFMSASHFSSSTVMKLAPVYETPDLRDDISSAKDEDAVSSGHGFGGEVETHSPGVSTACAEMRELLKQWLPVHSQPDAVEIIDNIPFTRHGKFTLILLLAAFFCHIVCTKCVGR